MKGLPLIFFAALIFVVNAPAQTSPDAACPVVSVSGGGVVRPGESMMFSVNIGSTAAKNISYRWTVSAGTIVSGQGTPVIEVDTTGLDDRKSPRRSRSADWRKIARKPVRKPGKWRAAADFR